jgi:hypothetical protein
MKIGILTQPVRGNYGGILQNYALQYILKEMGHNPVTLELYPWKMSFKSIINILKRLVLRLFFKRKDIDVFWEYHHDQRIKIPCKNTFKFIKRNINLLYVKDYKEISTDDFDALIVGSDQVWRPRYNPQQSAMFLDFASNWNIIKLAYAASFGTNQWEFSEDETSRYKEMLESFKAVSVREKTGIELCKKHFNVDAQFALDPTLLLDKSVYKQLCDNTNVTLHGIYCYILDSNQNKTDVIHSLSEARNEEFFSFNSKYEEWYAPNSERVQAPVEKWVKGFDNATTVVTDSFHGCVFSIIFNKEFYAFSNKERGNDRIQSLLETFGLEDRLIKSYSDIQDVKDIDWNLVNMQRNKLIDSSIQFLQENLS